jgi:prepilin-type N-terminal cleavage/methylation domain-containing protein
MKKPINANPRATAAFTLIELLVVIAIIGILAALILPLTGALKIRAARSKAQAELAQLALAIDDYKEKYGHYPPDVPRTSAGWPFKNQLYFELVGTKSGTNYVTLDGGAEIQTDAVPLTFGSGVRGFVNCTRGGNADDAPQAKTFLSHLKPTQSGAISTNTPLLKVLACSVQWPLNHNYQPFPDNPGLNPWRYDSSSTNRHNLDSYDLWVDILVGGKTNRISNWSRPPQIVSTP